MYQYDQIVEPENLCRNEFIDLVYETVYYEELSLPTFLNAVSLGDLYAHHNNNVYSVELGLTCTTLSCKYWEDSNNNLTKVVKLKGNNLMYNMERKLCMLSGFNCKLNTFSMLLYNLFLIMFAPHKIKMNQSWFLLAKDISKTCHTIKPLTIFFAMFLLQKRGKLKYCSKVFNLFDFIIDYTGYDADHIISCLQCL